MRSLSMRIANLHLLTKKSKFIAYPTKKMKSSKTKNFLLSETVNLTQADQTTISVAAATKLEVSPEVTVDHLYGKLKTIEEETELKQLNKIKAKK